MKSSPRWSKRKKRTEYGGLRRRWGSAGFSAALVFPEPYPCAMANLGLQVLYGALTAVEGLAAERVFLPESGPARSEESGRALSEFDILFVSLSFDSGILNLPRILHSSGIPPLSEERPERGAPLVLAGGIAAQLNPEPILPFVDAVLLGDLEPMEDPLYEIIPALASRDLPRVERLRILREALPWAYVPGASETPVPVAKAGGLKTAPRSFVVGEAGAFGPMGLVEAVRGCGQGCRFCAAGYLYRPPRPWSIEAVMAGIESLPSGIRSVGLVGLEAMGREELEPLVSELTRKGVRISFSSLRIDKMSREFARLLKRSGVKQATVAVEAGSERLRRCINKNLTEEAVLQGVSALRSEGLKALKVYAMLGLPFEEDEDVDQLVRLLGRIRDEAGKGASLTLSVSVFVPKPWTPFEREPLVAREVFKRRTEILRRDLKGVRLKIGSYRSAEIQAMVSRGDRRLRSAIYSSSVQGTPLKRALKDSGLEVEEFTGRRDGPLPWRSAGHPIAPGFLERERIRAEAGRLTPVCRPGRCRACGACEREREHGD